MSNADPGMSPFLLEGEVQRPAAAQPNPLLVIHRNLRGRYHWAAALGLALAAIGAFVGYNIMAPRYRSVGLVRVSPTVRFDIYQVDAGTLPMFESFVRLQADYLMSRRVIDRALERRDGDPDNLSAAGWPQGASGVGLLQRRLRAINPRGAQIVQVSVEHEEPRLAQKAVNAVLQAYESIFGEQAAVQTSQRQRNLEARVRSLDQEVSGLREDIVRISAEYGADTLDMSISSKVTELNDIDQRVARLRLQIVEQEGIAAGGAQTVNVTRDMLAAQDESLKNLIDQEASLIANIESQQTKLGPNHQTMKAMQRALDAKRTEIDNKVAKLMEAMGIPADGQAQLSGPLENLRRQEGQLVRLRSALAAEATDLGRKRSTLAGLKEQELERRNLLATARGQLEAIRAEEANLKAGRVSIEQWGDLPVAPASDRRIPLAGAGGAGGMVAGFAIVFLASFLRGGYRYIDEVEFDGAHASAPLLGTLPDLSAGDAEQEEMAAMCVHQLRNMLQLQPTRRHPDGASVYALTSASPGDGKTSTTLALGTSFAASGHRTLLIDSDFHGRGLTRSLGLSGLPGLVQAITAADLNGEMHPTSFPDVFAIPAGTSEGAEAQHLSKKRLHALLNKVRGEFDVILIDTGPILGSIEANLVAAAADGVVLMVSRGQDPRLVRTVLKRIAAINAVCCGMVFNRATKQDFVRSVSHGSLRSRMSRPDAVREPDQIIAPESRAAEERLLKAVSGRDTPGGAGGRT